MHFAAAAVAVAMVLVADVGNCGAFLAPSSIASSSTTTTRRLRPLDAPSSSSSSSLRMAGGDDEDAGVLNRFSR